jgi:hypothetical protein
MDKQEQEKKWIRIWSLISFSALMASASFMIWTGCKIVNWLYFLLNK